MHYACTVDNQKCKHRSWLRWLHNIPNIPEWNPILSNICKRNPYRLKECRHPVTQGGTEVERCDVGSMFMNATYSHEINRVPAFCQRRSSWCICLQCNQTNSCCFNKEASQWLTSFPPCHKQPKSDFIPCATQVVSPRNTCAWCQDAVRLWPCMCAACSQLGVAAASCPIITPHNWLSEHKSQDLLTLCVMCTILMNEHGRG